MVLYPWKTTTPKRLLHVKLIEPPYTERYVRWCERSEGEIIAFLLLDFFYKRSVAITILWCSVRVAPALCRGLGELPNKRKGINFCQQPYKGRRAKGYPFPLLAKSFVICSRVPHLATFQKDSAFQKSTFLFRFVRDDTLNMNT